ncbi:condensation domain-containing protein [Mangrovihabitans endophyticus]|uniref:Condensation domain-containing protein n=1 Tax=Mangrovihabitans endophyticus TaxID=1751298 RepID=A0A8J3BVP5_9ACTN|nr:condensation domain-containing protein [Mangrovihabitans endophyticus]GGK72691.1 hypothetical protein GCM10012284_03180 [Mangrovihabitans endophyticus]
MPNHPITAPLTFGQLSLLRSLQQLGPAGATEVNLAQAWRLPPDAGFETAERIWYDLVTHNESLRTTYEYDTAEPVQIVHSVSPQPLQRIELPGGGVEAATAHVVGMAAQPMAVDTDLPWRAVILTESGRPRFLGLTVHHVAVDMIGMSTLRAQYEALISGRNLETGCQPRELARVQMESHAWRREVLAYWAQEWTRLAPEDRRGADPTERVQAAMRSVDGLRAARTIAERLGISLQSVVLGAVYLVLCRFTGRDRATLGLTSSNRYDERSASVVSSMNQLAPLTIAVDLAAHPHDFLTRVFESSMVAYAHGCYSVDELHDHLARHGVPDPDPMKFDCYFNFLGDSGRAPDSDGHEITSIEWQTPARRTGPSLSLLVSTGPALLVVLRASRRYLGDGDVPGILGGVESTLIEIAAGPPADLAAVRVEPRAELRQT